MAITFPREFPNIDIASSDFRLAEQVAQDLMRSGEIAVTELGESLWFWGNVQTQPLDYAQRAEVSAWARSLRSGMRKFYGFDPDRQLPVAYDWRRGGEQLPATRFDGSPFNGTATLLSTTASTVELSNLPAGYKITADDPLSWSWNGVLAYHRALESAVADEAGLVEFEVTPHVRPGTIGTPVVSLVKPKCVMRLVPNSFMLQVDDVLTPATFSAVQALR